MKISEMLSGGDPRSLGRTKEVVDLVLDDKTKLDELFNCLFVSDAIVRMRAGDALEKVCRQEAKWLIPFIKKLFILASSIKQPSIQWHLAQIFSEVPMTKTERLTAITIMKNNLETTDDWIVENLTLESLAEFTRKGSLDKSEFRQILHKHTASNHKSVASRVQKLQKEFG